MAKAYYNNKTKRFQCDVYYSLNEGEKKRKKSLYGKTSKEAEKKANTFLVEVERGDYIDERRDTLINFLYDYCDVCSNKWEETTKSLYKMYIEVHFKPYFGDMLLKSIKPITLDKFYNYKLNCPRTYKVKKNNKYIDKERPPISINTVTKLNKFLKSAFNYAVKNDYIRKNPADNVVLARTEKYKPTIYNEDQFSKLLDAVKNTDDEIPIVLGAGCGLRRGEVLGLKWKNIDFENFTITIEKTSVRFDKTIDKDPKTETSKRSIMVPDHIIKLLENKFISEKPPMNQKIITRWVPQSYSEHFKILLKKHNLQHIRFHDLRHFNAVIMLKYGVSDKVAAERLGHSQVGTLKNVYQHVLQEMDAKAANQINSIFEQKEKASPE